MAVIGGGASGVIAAYRAAKLGADTILIEKRERIARKILITGKGRCNLTNKCTRDEFLAHMRTNKHFMYSSYDGFNSDDTMKLFEEFGVPLVIQRGSRVYPKSEKAMDIVDAMADMIKSVGVRVVHQTVTDVSSNQNYFEIFTEKSENINAKKVIVATGGLSYPDTGCTGDGYAFAKRFGHTLVALRPTLVGIELKNEWIREVAGLSLLNVRLSLFENDQEVHPQQSSPKVSNKKKKPIYSDLGEMIFTHNGVSGPLVLTASSYVKNNPENYTLKIDLKPGLTPEQLDARIVRDFEQISNKDFENSLDKLLPRSLISVIVALSGIAGDTKVNQITKIQRESLENLIKNLNIDMLKLEGIEKAVITAGGIDVREIDPKTMESRIVKGLYFCGEMLDLDALTGGFNLQIAFSTGYAAGTGAAKNLQ